MSSRLRQLPTDLADSRLFAREPGWEFSLMLSFELLFLFGAVPLLSGDRNVVTLLQLGLATTSIALIAKSAMLRAVLAGTFASILLARLLPDPLPRVVTLSAVLIYNVLVTGAMVRAVFGSGNVNHHRIAGAVFVYLNVALVFALLYAELRLASPRALSGIPAGATDVASKLIHFSFTSLTTIGDSDIHPSSPVARSLTDLETITGQLFPAILLSRLVGLHLVHTR